MEQGGRSADVEWRAYAWPFVVEYLRRHPDLFPDDLWKAGLERPRNARALGPLLNKARRLDLIEPSGEYRRWISKVYEQAL